jgi:hypothetical protein
MIWRNHDLVIDKARSTWTQVLCPSMFQGRDFQEVKRAYFLFFFFLANFADSL